MSQNMTWGAFKAAVEAKGIPDDMPIIYIDINNPNVEKDLSIELNTLGLVVADAELNEGPEHD